MSRVISFSSGKGGVGKTTLVANLGVAAERAGLRTLMIDGDWNLGKLSIVFGRRPQWTIESVLTEAASLDEAIDKIRPNLSLLASPSGKIGFEELSESQRIQLFFQLEELKQQYDLILFDHSSGIQPSVLHFAAACHQQVVVTTCEPTSYTDAYAIMKLLSKNYRIRDFSLIATQATDRTLCDNILSKFIGVTTETLSIRIKMEEIFTWDARVSESIRSQTPMNMKFPNSDFSLRVEQLLSRLMGAEVKPHSGLRFFHNETSFVQDVR